jgi:hypothetical protein
MREKTGKYNVIFMRDNENVRRLRFSPFWIKGAIYFLLTLFTCAVVGIYGGLTFWRANRALVQERADLQQRLDEAKVRLERLANVEKLLMSNDPDELHTLFGALSVDGQPAARPKAGDKPGEKASEGDKAQAPEPKAGPARVDLGKVKVENVRLKRQDKEMVLSFQLTSLNTAKPLAGRAVIEILRADGAPLAVEASPGETGFKIQSYKEMSASFPLPAGITAEGFVGVRLSIKTSDGTVVFSDNYPLSVLAS